MAEKEQAKRPDSDERKSPSENRTADLKVDAPSRIEGQNGSVLDRDKHSAPSSYLVTRSWLAIALILSAITVQHVVHGRRACGTV